MTRRTTEKTGDPASTKPRPTVFINCPFDPAYRDLFEACVFTILVAGFEPVCALSEDDFGDVRLVKLLAMIEACDLSIHDLSRSGAGSEGFARLNMPFELGLTIGARNFGVERQRAKRMLCMVERRFDMPKFLSDAAGNDPHEHGNEPQRAVKIVRNWLKVSPNGRRLIGPATSSLFLKHLNRASRPFYPALVYKLTRLTASMAITWIFLRLLKTGPKWRNPS